VIKIYWLYRLIAILSICFIGAQVVAAPSRDLLTLLVPDNVNVKDWPTQVWIDTAAEEGLQLQLIRDSEFLALGANAAISISGLILPDTSHIQASDALIAAVTQYVKKGGRLMLTYDAGALTERGMYIPAGPSRFSRLVGVDYVLYDTLRSEMEWFGPVVGTKREMDALSLPPGKYIPYRGATSAQNVKILAGLPDDANRAGALICTLGNEFSSSTSSQSLTDLRLRQLGVENNVMANAADTPLQAISGYAVGTVNYHHFVTTGAFPGQSLLCAAEGGLIAGIRQYGAGKLLFVNIPLGQYKAVRTDGALLHGFLNLFARDLVVMPRLSVQPKGVGGLIYNWHVDDRDDLIPDLQFVMAQDFMQHQGPFSIHFTVGPDVSILGDGLGIDLLNNPAGKTLLQHVDKTAHAMGSHGGWLHNIYGREANETNELSYLPWIAQNVAAIEAVIGHPLREYSAPVGNNPLWAIKWLELHGVVGMYTVGNTGTAALREWRSGQRVSETIWAMPIAPFGKTATFEEFQRNGISDQDTAQWLLDLVDFVVKNRTNRLFYNHPPGAKAHLGVVKKFVEHAADLARLGRFHWYTMAQIADFSQRRLQTTWHSSCPKKICRFVAENPVTLKDITWLLPRALYDLPNVTQGLGIVDTSDPRQWLVSATS
jgi:hypothetical protein